MVILLGVRVSGAACGFGDGVSKERGLVVTAAFHGVQTAFILVSLKISGNLADLYCVLRDSRPLPNEIPSISEMRPERSTSPNVSSRVWRYGDSSESPRNI